jgi:hypothetical protein
MWSEMSHRPTSTPTTSGRDRATSRAHSVLQSRHGDSAASTWSAMIASRFSRSQPRSVWLVILTPYRFWLSMSSPISRVVAMKLPTNMNLTGWWVKARPGSATGAQHLRGRWSPAARCQMVGPRDSHPRRESAEDDRYSAFPWPPTPPLECRRSVACPGWRR